MIDDKMPSLDFSQNAKYRYMPCISNDDVPDYRI